MLVLALLAATATAQLPAQPRVQAVEQARASVRIVAGVRVTAEQLPRDAIVRETKVESADGSQTSARLVEFP